MKNTKICSSVLSAALIASCIPAVNASAASDTITYNGHYYMIIDKSYDWSSAKLYCESMGGHLATITSDGEQAAVADLLNAGGRNSYWLGGLKDPWGSWQWITGESFDYTCWTYRQPDNHTGTEDSLMMYRNENPKANTFVGGWNDLQSDGDCNGESFFGLDNIGFICEWDSESAYKGTSSQTITSSSYSTMIIYLEQGDKLRAGALIKGAVADNVKYTTTSKKVAKVSKSGVITAVGPGVAVIKAKCGNKAVRLTVIVE